MHRKRKSKQWPLTVRLALQNFRRNVSRCTTLTGDGQALGVGRKPKIGQLDVRIVALAREKQVLGLEVSVDDVLVVAVLDGLEDGEHQIAGFFLTIVSLLHDAIEQFTAVEVLQHNVVMLIFLEKIDQSGNVGVVQLAKNRNLLLQRLIIRLRKILAGDNLYSDFSFINHTGAGLDDRVTALAQDIT